MSNRGRLTFALAVCVALLGAGQVPDTPLARSALKVDETMLRSLIADEVARQVASKTSVLEERIKALETQVAALSNEPAKAGAILPKSPMVEDRLLNELRIVRSQLTLYALQHEDRFPTLAQAQDGWSVLTRKTDAKGTLDAGKYGPYLIGAPRNPMTGFSAVVGPDGPFDEAGWVYDPSTGKLWALVPKTAGSKVLIRYER